MNASIESQIKLDNLQADEAVVLALRRHWIVFLYLGGYAFVLLSSTSAFFIYRESAFSLFSTEILGLCLTFYWACFLVFLYVEWANNELDLFIITNKRIIGIDQLSFLNRIVSECSLNNALEVNAQTKGLLQNILNYGSITIHTASEQSHFLMETVPMPVENSRRIKNIIDEYRKNVTGVSEKRS